MDRYHRDPSRAWTATDVVAQRDEDKPGKMDILDDSAAIWAEGSSEKLLGKPRPRLGIVADYFLGLAGNITVVPEYLNLPAWRRKLRTCTPCVRRTLRAALA